MSDEKIDKIDALSSKKKVSGAGLDPTDVVKIEEPDKAQFDALMQRKAPEVEVALAERAAHKPGMIDGIAKAGGTFEPYNHLDQSKLVAQAQNTVATIEKAKETLATTQVQLSAPVQRLMKNKLNHVEDNIKIAMSKVGVEYSPPDQINNLSGPIERFLGMLTSSQHQLANIGTYIEAAAAQKKLTPGDMLSIQLKMSVIQQELELFISLLNQGLQSIKTVMNVQV